MSRRRGARLAGALIALAVVLFVARWLGGGSPQAGPLSGKAALVAEFREASSPLLSLKRDMSPEERHAVCRSVAEELNKEIDPSALLIAALSVPDPELSELAVDDRVARSDLLLSCGARDELGTVTALKSARAIDTLFKDRLSEL